MGTYTYIVVAAFAVISGLAILGLEANTSEENQELFGAHFKEEARDAAVTGLNLTIRRVGEDQNPWIDGVAYKMGPAVFGNAIYETFVEVYGGDTVDVTATGTRRFIDRMGRASDTTHTIEVRIVRADLAGGGYAAYGPAITSWTER